MTEEVEEQSGTVRAVIRAMDVLKSFDGVTAPMSVVEIRRRVALSRPTLYRLLATLVEAGMLEPIGEPQRFRLGRMAARLGQSWLAQIDVTATAGPVLDRLRDETGESAALFMLRDNRQVCVLESRSRNALAMSRGIGELEDGFRGASGKAILAWLSADRAHLLIEQDGVSAQQAVTDAELSTIRTAGHAVSHGAVFEGALSIAAPVFDRRDEVIGSLGLFGPEARMDGTRLQALVNQVELAAARISSHLGAPETRLAHGR